MLPLTWLFIHLAFILPFSRTAHAKTCTLSPLGVGKDDTDQVEQAIATCGNGGKTVFESGTYNITRKMTWNLTSATVDLNGYLSFKPDIQFWLNATNTYRVVFIQNQASWFVVTGSDFVIDAHNTGGIQGNGQPWWSYFQTHPRADGDGRPISLTLWKATRGVIRNFRIVSPPFWSNTAAESSDIEYNGMYVNATNTDPLYIGKNAVPNTDGINTYRSDKIVMLNWDVTCGDDCLAVKGNSSNIIARNITCRGGNGIAFGSIGQYADMNDNISNVILQDLLMTRIDPNVQPNMANGVYFKTWTGSVHGVPPTGGGGGSGAVNNVVVKGVHLDRVNIPLHLYQTNGGHTGDAPSTLKFSNLRFADWTGTAVTNRIVDIECSAAVGCSGVSFAGYNISGPAGQAPRFICQNIQGLSGLSAPCNATGQM
ncbi:putative glycosyl hydrolase 28 family protein [Lyophyllum shimeji]|uniref:galacturonan 1,4-alpha-galacturonidase n=1 Tax=Lyophyllum shimeji TaxID=47721 RepID=A0A9P3UP56_LYOSH|nr:putative glycosyl hydrolase 28 family protein [Lyophyllum shimeji]